MPAQVSVSTKRKAIADSNRMMFIWVAGMSAVIGACVVVIIFLAQQIGFHARVIAAETATASTLQKNNDAIVTLKQNIAALEPSDALNSVKATPDEKALQVILDALPADRNTLALGSSLQQRLLTGVDGISVESISVDESSTLSSASDTSDTDATSSGVGTIPISLKVSATSASALKDLLTQLERSIRVIDIDSVVIEVGSDSYEMTLQAHAYYNPPVSVELTEQTVKR